MLTPLSLLLLLSSTALATSSITWLHPQRSAIIKLDTPTYPFWQLDKVNAPSLLRSAAPYYEESPTTPSAILLNLTLALDSRSLFLNNEQLLPLKDANVPPQLKAYQVPASIPERKVRNIVEAGVLDRERGWEDLTLAWRLLDLDYDRLVSLDGGGHHGSATLRFRVLGIGAHQRSDVLDAEKQKVVHVKVEGGREYRVTDVQVREVGESYEGGLAVERQTGCSLWSWRCGDQGVRGCGAGYYRFVWRERFDGFGRVGSLRHAVMKKGAALKEFWEDAGASMVFAWAVLTSIAVGLVLVVKGWQAWREQRVKRREELVRRVAEVEGLLGEDDDGEGFYGDDDEKELDQEKELDGVDGITR
ncbi:hypothetical protein BS50DRAFT_589192 [Corynespora cassiicola Philippines]|uniref:Uncharacterized protein n=1 Tax=Corynespora cassiicola Philippines TaxID=1448308 RepID=A0A2T2NM68_CORCC|nr:hypothetical protein BS50DRAFT_589192 [Corynespora cassiicola Philippines]